MWSAAIQRRYPRNWAPVLALGLWAASGALSCGAERDYTGVWQQVCDPEEAPEPCGEFVVEAHLGRYGDQVTGLLVQYLFRDVALYPYQRSNECGCWFLNQGRALSNGLAFELFEPDVPRVPDEAFEPDLDCAPSAAQMPPACDGTLYNLREDGDDLLGEVRCEGETRPIRLRPTAGRPRRVCLAVPAL